MDLLAHTKCRLNCLLQELILTFGARELIGKLYVLITLVFHATDVPLANGWGHVCELFTILFFTVVLDQLLAVLVLEHIVCVRSQRLYLDVGIVEGRDRVLLRVPNIYLVLGPSHIPELGAHHILLLEGMLLQLVGN